LPTGFKNMAIGWHFSHLFRLLGMLLLLLPGFSDATGGKWQFTCLLESF